MGQLAAGNSMPKAILHQSTLQLLPPYKRIKYILSRYSLNAGLDDKTKMKIIIIACLLSCLLDSTFGVVTTFECNGETGFKTAVQDGPGGSNGYICSIGIGGNQAEGKHVCERLQEIDDECDYFKPRKTTVFGGSFGSSFGGGGGQTRCVTTCQSNGGCRVEIVNGPPGKKSGSCFPPSFRGECSGIPDKCKRGTKISTQCGSPCKAGTRNV